MAGPRRDPYAILGMPRGADRRDLAAAYRRLAKEIHPDLTIDAAPDMRELNWAWQILSDPARRRAWDAEHPIGANHWSAARVSRPAGGYETTGAAAPVWSPGMAPAQAREEPGRFAALGCLGLTLLAILMAGLIVIGALASNLIQPPPADPVEQEAQESRAP